MEHLDPTKPRAPLGRHEYEPSHQSSISYALDGPPESASLLETVISHGIETAIADETNVQCVVAQSIARVASLALDYETPALEEFARSGHGSREQLELEYLDLYANPDTPDEVRQWIDWLAAYVFFLEAPMANRSEPFPPKANELEHRLVRRVISIDGQPTSANFRLNTSLAEVEAATSRLDLIAASRGKAFLIYLSLDTVDAETEDIEDRFAADYAGSYESVGALLDGFSDLSEWKSDLARWADERGLDGLVTLDESRILERIQNVYEVCDVDGGLYVFYR